MDSQPTADGSNDEIVGEIADLERRLAAAKAKLARPTTIDSTANPPAARVAAGKSPPPPIPNTSSSATHFLLLLADSALPLGSFAFSSGLESYLAHSKAFLAPLPRNSNSSNGSFAAFLPVSVSSYASTTLPFVLAAHRDASSFAFVSGSSPRLARLAALDDALDAAIVCTVGRRASVAQGRALLSIWERSFVGTAPAAGAAEALKPFVALLKSSSSSSSSSSSLGTDLPPPVSAHLAPLFGAICQLVGLSLEQTAYVFMLGHIKALVSAAVRAGMFGPYQAQKTLAGGTVQGLIAAMIEREWDTPVEMAGQRVPVMDLWFGRHEVLYSRIFNS
ncbi:hypothetical protein B0T26DRAFT_638976 [Lasiosphaeria miniovina]|uniref:Urease accessory protein UreF n=1 Tax=Lasiosphaeria miniovina TaxID=1954250 RepID=A0AA40B5G4_9PEZI|nr:uncharacterized protein B0T26DRAFT_638976 [Lasiosphaeria miniovina]KAK0727907.1 hypothetical protein B0T26DRAFT_638976 [Lasiosphaeria miniovina]